jgi:membrane protein required for colicin V production
MVSRVMEPHCRLWAVGGTAFAPVDFLVMAVVALAVARGLLRGLLRESFSIASLAAAVIGVKFFVDDVGRWLQQMSEGRITEYAAPWLAGFLIVLGAVGITTALGRVLRRGAKAAGLGWADRAGGIVMGTAEGMLIAGILLTGAIHLLGRSHEILAGSRSLQAMDELQEFAATGEIDLENLPLPSVAAPPPDVGRNEYD